jgi:hypothetical protein
MTTAEQSPATSAQSSACDLGLTATVRLSPVRKVPQSSFSEHCPSVSSAETRKISKLWKRVAKHCKIEKILRVSSTRNRKGKRESVLSSDVSIKGTIYTESSEASFEALERDSFLQPTRGQRVSIDITSLPLIYPSEAGYYAAPNPMSIEIRHSVGGDVYKLENVINHSSVVYEEPANDNSEDTATAKSDFLLEEPEEYEAGVGVGEKEVKVEIEAVNNEVFAVLKDMQEGYTFLRLQMQLMQKAIQKLGVNGRSTASALSS